jgi:hypothetical protein
MDSTSRELISKLNDRLLNQTVIIQTLCNILIEKEVISQEELEERITESVEVVNGQLKELETVFNFTPNPEEVEFDFTNYYGPVGEA